MYEVPQVTSVCLSLLWQTKKFFTNNGIFVDTDRSCSKTSQPGELLGSKANWANLNSEIKKKLFYILKLHIFPQNSSFHTNSVVQCLGLMLKLQSKLQFDEKLHNFGKIHYPTKLFNKVWIEKF